MLHWRPRNRFEDIDGMYLVGGGTHPGSGLPVIYEGARITSKLICDDFGAEFPTCGGGIDAQAGVSTDGGGLLDGLRTAARVASGGLAADGLSRG
jgi:hypothetical protein